MIYLYLYIYISRDYAGVKILSGIVGMERDMGMKYPNSGEPNEQR